MQNIMERHGVSSAMQVVSQVLSEARLSREMPSPVRDFDLSRIESACAHLYNVLGRVWLDIAEEWSNRDEFAYAYESLTQAKACSKASQEAAEAAFRLARKKGVSVSSVHMPIEDVIKVIETVTKDDDKRST